MSVTKVIANITELKRYTSELAKRFPVIAADVELLADGLSEKELKSVEDSIGTKLPPIYRNLAGTLGLFGVSIGFFGLWPTFSRKGTLDSSLIAANQTNEDVNVKLREQGLVIVARQEANPICVGASKQDTQDKVFRIDVMSSPELKGQQIAPSYESFLLLAGNLHQISERYKEAPKDGIAAIARCCDSLGCCDEERKFWIARAEEMLS